MSKLLKLSLIAIFSQVLTFSVQAEDVKLLKGDEAISFVSGTVGEVARLCPANARCFTDGSVVRVYLNLGGCMDRLGPVAYKVVHNEDNTADIYLSAVSILNKRSALARCLAPKKIVEIPMVNKFYEKEDVKLHVLRYLRVL